MKWIAALCH